MDRIKEEKMEVQPAEQVVQPEKKQRSSAGKVFAWTGLFLLLGLIGVAMFIAYQGAVQKEEKAPDFTLTTFDGEQIKLSDLRGKVVVVNFWASWCNPCEDEAPDLEAAWRHYEPTGEVVFLGVDYVDTEPEAMRYLEKFDITYPNGPDLGTRISHAYRIVGVPETYIVDKNGVVTDVQIGPFPSLSAIQRMIDPLLSN